MTHNNVIKQHTKYAAQERPQFVEKMKKPFATQKEEIERADIGMEEYRVTSQFSNLTVDTRKYFQKSEQQRERALKQLFIAAFKDPGKNITSDPGDTEGSEAGGEYPLRKLSIPPYIAEKVWTEGQELASTDSILCASPGCTDGGSWLVKSNTATHQKPFFVECKKTGQISCEKSCLRFNSCSVCVCTQLPWQPETSAWKV